MNIIFLDIDGVLNSAEGDLKAAVTGRDLMAPDPKLVVRLLGILQETGAKIVLTSTWRLDKTMTWPFPVYDKTPRGPVGDRCDEIVAWLNAHLGETEAFVIVDDEPDAFIGFDPEVCVHVDSRTGLDADDAARIVGLFT